MEVASTSALEAAQKHFDQESARRQELWDEQRRELEVVNATLAHDLERLKVTCMRQGVSHLE